MELKSEFAHVHRLEGYDVCLCFEAGERGPDGEEGVVVRRKAAGTLRASAKLASNGITCTGDEGVDLSIRLSPAFVESRTKGLLPQGTHHLEAAVAAGQSPRVCICGAYS